VKKASRILVLVLLGPVLLLFLTANAVLFVGLTETGTHWVLERVRNSVNAAPGSTLQWGRAEGTLLTGLDVRDFRYATTTESGALEITIPHLAFSWQPLGLLNYAVVIDPLQIDGLSYAVDTRVQNAPAFTVDELRAVLFDLPVSIELPDVTIRNFGWRRNARNFAIESLSGSAALTTERLQFSQLELKQGATTASGEVQLEKSFAAQGSLRWQTRIEQRDYSGELTIAGNLQQLQLSHGLAQPVQINSSGALVPGFLTGQELSLDLRHTFALLDLAPFGQEGIVLQQGDIVTAGSLEALEISGILQAQVRELAPMTLNLALVYQPELLTIDSLQLGSSQLAMNASGVLQLSPRSLQLDWTLAHVDPGAALPKVRLAAVTGEGSVAMSGGAEGQQVTVTISRLEGVLNDLPLGISGMLELTDSQLSALNLQVNNGANILSVTGTAAAQALALDWQLQAPQLQQLWQGLDGALAGQGSLRGTLAAPELNGQLDGSEISWQSNANTVFLQSLQVLADASEAGNDITLKLGSVALQRDDVKRPILEQASIMLAGTPARHTVSGELALNSADVVFAMEGAVNAGNWRGTLQSSSLIGSYGNWQQDSEVALAYEDDALAMAESCWNYALIRMCLQGEKAAGSGLNASLVLRNLPMSWLDSVTADANVALMPKPLALQELQDARGYSLPPGLQAEGDLDVQINLVNFSGGDWESLNMVFLPENTVLQVDFAEGNAEQGGQAVVERFGFTANTLQLSKVSGVWSGEIDLRIVKQTGSGNEALGNISGQLALTAVDELDGEFALGVSDLAWVESVTPTLSEPHGVLNGRITIAGTQAAPLLTGRLQLADAGFALPEYGLVITDLELTLQNLANNEFILDGRASSGAGTLAMSTTLSNLSTEDRKVTAEITGTDFSVINTSYARANISPQLQLAFADQELTVSGAIILPLVDLDLEAMFATAGRDGVDVSRDVVVLNATEEDAVASGRQTIAVPLHADISLLLGDSVRLRGYGLNTRLNGELALEQAPNRPVLVYGELGIPEGSFEIYNQVLNARDGRLMFFGNPANPVVNIRAFRETNDAEVGMLLSGSIKNMQGTLYSSPDLPEDEILSLLITGKSFNNINDQDGSALLGAIANFGLVGSSGLTSKVSSRLGFDSFSVGGGSTLQDSALGLGKYLTPDLLMRYKIGLFDRQSALSIDYNLTEHIKLEVETGISQSVDISYTIETD
jgi:translocation and assembly module TamB